MKKTGILIVSLYLSLVFISCKDPNQNNNRERVVRIAPVISGQEQTRKEFPFIAIPFRTSELSFRVGGPIDQLEVYAGNFYKQGDIIAEIDSRDFRIRKERTQAVYQQAKAEFERIQVLYEKRNLSASTFEKAKADYISAKTAYETAVYELSDTRLRAPFDGYIGEVYIEKFQDVKPSQPIVSFIDIDRLKIQTYVTQEIAFNCPEHQEAELRFDAMPDKPYKAMVTEISKSTTSNNLSYLLTVLLPNQKDQLPAGMSGKLSLKINSGTDCTTIIPQQALCHRPAEGNYVWTIDTASKRVTRKKITPGKMLPDGKLNVSEGLNAGEIVVISGLRFLSEGMKVQIAPENRTR